MKKNPMSTNNYLMKKKKKFHNKKPLKILMLIPRDGISGGIFVSYIQAQALYESGEDIKICFIHEQHLPKITTLKLSVPMCLYQDEVVAQHRYDVVIATWWETLYDAMHINAERVIYFCQSDERRFYPVDDVNRIWVQNTYIHKDIGVITEARWIQKLLQKDFGLTVEYAPNGIDLKRFNPSVPPLKPKENKLRILIEGPGDVPFKRVDLAFRVANKFDDIEVWYVSATDFVDASWRFTERFVKVPYYEMPKIYRSCDILLKLSTVEGFFGPPLEMMACGGTALVSNVTGHEEYIKDGYNALVVPMDDQEAAESKLRELINNEPLRLRLCANGIKTAQKLAWQRQTPKFREAVHEIVAKVPITSYYTKTRILLDGYNKETILKANKILKIFESIKSIRFVKWSLNILHKLYIWKKKKITKSKTTSLKFLFLRYKLNQLSSVLYSKYSYPEDFSVKLPPGNIAFAGQPEYFKVVYFDPIADGYGYEFPINSYDLRNLQDLPAFIEQHKIKSVIVFRPEFFADYIHILKYLKKLEIVLIGYSTEPIPHDGQITFHYDQLTRLRNLLKAKGLPYDMLVHMDRSSLRTLRYFGFNKIVTFPLPTSRKLYYPIPDCKKKYDVLFLGRSTEYREYMMSKIKQKLNVLHISHGLPWEEKNQVINESHIVLNLHNEPYPNFENRALQALFAGANLVSEQLSGGYLTANKHYYLANTPEKILSTCEKILDGRLPKLQPPDLQQFTMEAFLRKFGYSLPS
ncbi:MAG: glycosyltransferase family 4 protein [Patescibacteria group bacterium]|nr:glycosyltransferase family 4 protein [Patescibacteria group bacterium]